MLKKLLKLFLFLLIIIEIKCLSINHKNPNKIDVHMKHGPCPDDIKCVPKIQCPAHVQMAEHEKPKNCDLPAGKPGFCCLTGQNHTVPKRNKRMVTNLPQMQNAYIEEAQTFLKAALENQEPTVGIQKPQFSHHMMYHSTPEDSVQAAESANVAMQQILAMQIFQKKEDIAIEDIQTGKVQADFSHSIMARSCPVPVHCPNLHAKYRTFDGTCNNPLRISWGAADQPMQRLVTPTYEDGIWAPRKHSVDGSLLQGAREISRTLLPDINRPHPEYNLLLMQFGQFIAHDVTQSGSVTLGDGQAVECCTADGSRMLPKQSRHFACMPIRIEPHDEFYSKFNQGCMNFVRLALVQDQHCLGGYGKQRSRVTHYLDGSVIYGSNQKTANELRTFQGGKLRMTKDYARELLPTAQGRKLCNSVAEGSVCFRSGDARTNQILTLTVLHIIFAREHNRIATVLSAINPHHNDEILYQETRRIVTAQFQHIIYNEFLPLIIGSSTMSRFNLHPRIKTYSTDYNPDINPAITNAFTGAAYRFGHSTIDGKFKYRKANYLEEHIDIPDFMFNPNRLLERDMYDDTIRMLLEQPMQKFDNSISHGITRFLFRGNNPFGLDLAALNIQRGRDQGLGTYNDYLELAGLHRIQSFDEFHPEVAKRLSLVYKHPDDIDVWLGGIIEPSLGDALIGPTFAEIIGEQFSRFRHGDRYFYDNDPQINPGHFRPEQLEEIRRVTLAGIICENLDYFTTNEVSPKAFLRADLHGNSPKRCDGTAIPRINLNAWRENKN